MKRLFVAATVAIIGLSYTTSLQAQTSTQTIKTATKHKNSAAKPKADAKHCDVAGGATHNNACY